MSHWIETYIQDLDGELDELACSIEVRPAFLYELREEDDWSFVIKLHAVFEAVLAQALVTHVGNDDLADVFSRIDISDTKKGKIAFARRLKIINDTEYKFIAHLSELRNMLVHNIKNVEFSFDSYVRSLSPSQLNHFVESVLLHPKGEKKDATWDRTIRDVSTQTKPIMWILAMNILAKMFLQRQTVMYQRISAEFDDLDISLSVQPDDNAKNEKPELRDLDQTLLDLFTNELSSSEGLRGTKPEQMPD